MSMVEIGFSKSRKSFPIVGWLIQWMQLGRYSHTWCKLYYRGQWWAIDATAHTVRVMPWERFLEDHRPVKVYRLSELQVDAEKLFWWGMKRSGQPYSKLEIIGNLFQIVLRWFGVHIKNPFGQGDRYQRCNELVAVALEEVFGHLIEEDLDSIDLIWLDNYLQEFLWHQK